MQGAVPLNVTALVDEEIRRVLPEDFLVFRGLIVNDDTGPVFKLQ